MLSNPLLLGDSSSYQIANSLRFRASNSARLTRTPAGAGNLKTYTISLWLKRGQVNTGGQMYVFNGYNGATSGQIYFTATDQINFGVDGNAGYQLVTNAVYRDPSAWYHVVVVCDTTQATAANRLLMYVNGVQVTSFASTSYPPQNNDTFLFGAYLHTIGATFVPSLYFDGYIAEFNAVNGQALTPNSFGETNADGVWVPKKYSGTYGTNGFYLPFNDASNLTNLCLDRSGNGNNWTASGVSLTAGVTYDWMVDTPTNNYAVLNPLAKYSGVTASEANLTATHANTNWNNIAGTIGVSSGKWYWEATPTTMGSGCQLGVAQDTFNWFGFAGASVSALGYPSNGWAYINNAFKYNSNVTTAYGASYTTTDVISVVLDMDAGTITFYKNGSTQGQAFSGLSGTVVPGFGGYDGTVWKANFGQRPFTYTPPTGFKALCTANLPAVAITNPKKHFDALTQLGSAVNTGANLLAQFTNFVADFAWGKDRAAVNNHQLVDTVRGNTNVLQSNTTAAETTYSAPTSGDNCVAWGWKANGAAVTNNSGSISSQVSANTTAGFSIVTYTGTGANATVGHGLGVAPKLVIVKNRDQVGDHCVWHTGLGSAVNYMQLNTTGASGANATIFNSTLPTSSVFSIGSYLYGNGVKYVAYCFAEIPGYSKIGSWTNNNSTDGAFIYCGFRPAFILLKNSDNVESWYIYDSKRHAYNVAPADSDKLYANASNAEGALSANTATIDILANGFKIRTTNPAASEISFGTRSYIFLAFAENPFGGSNTSPALAR